jgi:hypothetical protein
MTDTAAAHLLGYTGSHNTSSSGGGHQADGHGATLAGDLGGHSVHLSNFVTPVSTSHGHHGHLGLNDGSTDGGGHLCVCVCVCCVCM